ncbi:MAG TPA: N-acetylneuraminate synthase [Gemmatimonadaceae bacterium]|nr:N-acetylneuraminate synthase [Gemmatimonadaceae bacterium]
MSVAVGTRRIGDGAPCYVIAEAGVNHNGDAELAHRLVDIAADAGADAVKFQTFDPDLLASPGAVKADYQIENTGTGGSQHEMLMALTLPRSVFADLARHATERRIEFLSTPFDLNSADLLADIGVSAFKIGSGEVTNHPFLARLAGFGRPLLLSTGMSTLDEVVAAVGVIQRSGNPPLALFHCVTSYPVDAAACNLRAMQTLRDRFRVPVGWSDHTVGGVVSIAAVALGAELIEKHFTVDRTLPGPDHAASLEPDELRTLVADIRSTESALGDGRKVPAACELGISKVARRSLHFSGNLPAGHAVRPNDLVALRPATGLSPALHDQLVGRVLRVDVARGDIVREDQLV